MLFEITDAELPRLSACRLCLHALFHLWFALIQVPPFGIFIGYDGDGQWPPEAQTRVAVEQPALSARRVKLADLIAGFSDILEHLIAMRETLRDKERAVIIRSQFHRDVLKVGRAFRPKVNNDVKNRAARAADNLCLRRWGELEVHATQRPLLMVEGHIGLGDDRLESVGLKLLLTEGASEETASVCPGFNIDDVSPFEFCFGKYHNNRSLMS